jgi:hypothetical protein
MNWKEGEPMGVIYDLLKLPKKDRKKFLEAIIHKETMERLKSQRDNNMRYKINQ